MAAESDLVNFKAENANATMNYKWSNQDKHFYYDFEDGNLYCIVETSYALADYSGVTAYDEIRIAVG